MSLVIDNGRVMVESPNVSVGLPNRPENVVLAREIVTGLCEQIGLGPVEVNDLQTALTEACNNVVLHAYEGDEGPLQIELYVLEDAIEILVSDVGVGIAPRIREVQSPGLGIGLQVIHALAQHVEFNEANGAGTEIRMRFEMRPAHPPQPPAPSEHAFSEETSGAMTITLAPAALARTVLPRILCTLTANGDFSTARINDAQMLADALAAHLPPALSADHMSIRAKLAPRDLRIRVGPLRAGGPELAARGSQIDGLGAILDSLVDERDEEPEGSCWALLLRISERR